MTIQAVVKMSNQQLASPSISIKDFSDVSLKNIIADVHHLEQREALHLKVG